MGSLVVIGNFDGVHRGHQALLSMAEREARALDVEPLLLSFVPHPAIVLGRTAPAVLTTSPRKRELVARHAPNVRVVEQPFDLAFAAQSPEEFVEHLVREHAPRLVLVGDNFRFGKGRVGDLATLRELGAARSFEARSHDLVGDADGPWSSTRARKALATGDLDEVARILGRPHMLEGEVVHGKKLGRTIGVPTANLAGIAEALPPLGVYAALVDRIDAGSPRALAKAAVSIGKNPTTDDDEAIKVEAFLLDFDAELYGERLRIHLVERLRGEERFDGLDALVAQMGRDIEATRARLEGVTVDPSTGAFG
jgi:riboflavin kinase / FMN adenylyltransferase